MRENMEISKEELKDILEEAFRLLYEKDRYLIIYEPSFPDGEEAYHAGERSIVARFAHYLQNIFEDRNMLANLAVDTEYNRHGYDIKRLPHCSRRVYPDLIVHHRGDDEENFLVMEFKTWWNPDTKGDIKKLEDMMDKEKGYGYRYGISVLLGENGPEIRWIEDSQIHTEMDS